MSFRSVSPRAGAVLVLAMATCLPLHASDFSGNIALTSDYVFRGISQTQGAPALQAGVRVDADSGFYGAAWASEVDFAGTPGASAEIDYIAGWQQQIGGDWSGDLNATWFTYASATELDYMEWIATATWRDRAWLMLGASSDVFATGKTGLYAQAGTRIPIHDAVRIEFATGYYRLDRPYGRSYAHGQATVAWQVHPKVELRLSGHLIDRNARVVFGDPAGARIEAALQTSF